MGFRGIWLVLTSLLLTACTTPPSTEGFALEYLREYAWKGYKEIITVSETGRFEYRQLDYQTGELVSSVSGELSDPETQTLTDLVIRTGRFFTLPEDLTVQNCLDAADETIEVQAGGRSHTAGGYCVENRAFRAIVDSLYAYKRGFSNE